MANKGQREKKVEAYRLIEATHWLMEKAARIVAFDKGVTYEQARILTLLFKANKPQKPLDMAKTLRQAPHTVSGILKRMGQKGWIRRYRGAFKGHPNWVEVRLTEKGRDVYLSMPDLEAVEVLGLDVLTNKELDQLTNLLRLVRTHAADQVRSLPRTKLPEE